MNRNNVILGVMSGTSLDGLDFALCRFNEKEDSFLYKILKTGFVPYDLNFKTSLSNAHHLSSFELIKFHKNYGTFIGKHINEFIKDTVKPNYIASHGHTIFHKPDENLTFQLGDAAFIAAETNISVISDFRNLDTALKGQGAPLVPIGDKYLFSDYDFCINLGGFANISFDIKGERTAFDVCPVNIVVNEFVKELNLQFDKDGNIGKNGKMNPELLKQLNKVSYYSNPAPKSLGREYVEHYFQPVFNQFNIPVEDKIRTFYKHIAIQISNIVNTYDKGKILLTGGGTHNVFLVHEIQSEMNHEIIIPDKEIINFKEAIIFAFLGYLRINERFNTLNSYTGASKNSVGGSIFII